MRVNDEKVRAIARATGMLFKKRGVEYATCVRVGGLEMSFEYANPDTHAYIEICNEERPHRNVASYIGNELDIAQIKKDYPQFFI